MPSEVPNAFSAFALNGRMDVLKTIGFIDCNLIVGHFAVVGAGCVQGARMLLAA
jgi:hypothetical protein